jgi:hypothetical protein
VSFPLEITKASAGQIRALYVCLEVTIMCLQSQHTCHTRELLSLQLLHTAYLARSLFQLLYAAIFRFLHHLFYTFLLYSLFHLLFIREYLKFMTSLVSFKLNLLFFALFHFYCLLICQFLFHAYLSRFLLNAVPACAIVC